MAMELRVPALGESVREATLGAWKHVEGDEVSVDEPLVEVESEKATVRSPRRAPASSERFCARRARPWLWAR